MDDDSSSSDPVDDFGVDETVTSNNASFSGYRNRIGSLGGNFTRMYVFVCYT